MRKSTYCLLVALATLIFSCSKNTDDKPKDDTPKEIPLQSISISKQIVDLKIGDSYKVEFSLYPSNTTDSIIEWNSNDQTVATIQNMTISAVKAGSCKIIGKSKKNGITVNIAINVSNIEISQITFINPPTEIKIGQTHQLVWNIEPGNATNKNVVFSSSNDAIATVSPTGLIQAVSVGDVIISVKSDNNKSAIANVKVTPILVGNITLSLSENIIEEGLTKKISATIIPANATNKKVIWSSSNETSATVDQSGNVTAKKAGSAIILAKSEDGNAQSTMMINIVDFSYFVKANSGYLFGSYNSSTGLFTGKMWSTLYNDSSKDITVISVKFFATSASNPFIIINNVGVVQAAKEYSTQQWDLYNIYKPYIVWEFSYNGKTQTKEVRNFL